MGNFCCEGCGLPPLVRYGTQGVSRCESLCRVCARQRSGWTEPWERAYRRGIARGQELTMGVAAALFMLGAAFGSLVIVGLLVAGGATR